MWAPGGVIGGVVGGLGIGALSSFGSKKLLDKVITDDADEMSEILNGHILQLASDFMLTNAEFNVLVEEFRKKVDQKFRRDMFASTDRIHFVESHFESSILELISKRPRIKAPSASNVVHFVEAASDRKKKVA